MKDIEGRKPINGNAAIVTSKGVEYRPDFKLNAPHFNSCPDLVPVSKGEADLTGTKFGEFIVLGKVAKSTGRGSGALWAVRCSCGTYEVRRRKAILNKENFGDRCKACLHSSFLKREDIRRRTNAEVDIRKL